MAIPGLRYVAEYLSVRVHDQLLAAADANPWRTMADRRAQVYGYTYDHTQGGIYRLGPLPPWASDLAASLVLDGLMPLAPDQLIVNDYPSGTGIPAHVDHAAFDDTIVSISLGSTCVMELSPLPLATAAHAVLLEPRSALVLAGEARHHWTHAIPPRPSDVWEGIDRPRGRRVSLTFRTMRPEHVVA